MPFSEKRISFLFRRLDFNLQSFFFPSFPLLFLFFSIFLLSLFFFPSSSSTIHWPSTWKRRNNHRTWCNTPTPTGRSCFDFFVCLYLGAPISDSTIAPTFSAVQHQFHSATDKLRTFSSLVKADSVSPPSPVSLRPIILYFCNSLAKRTTPEDAESEGYTLTCTVLLPCIA